MPIDLPMDLPTDLPTTLLTRVPTEVHTLAATLKQKGFRTWAVGGSLRDLLLGKPVSDWDLATDALPHDVQAAFKRTLPTGIKHGTVTVCIGSHQFEVTTLRGEGAYSDGRHPDSIAFIASIEEDLRRRDFTVNAIAYDLADQQIIDPFHGMTDLKSGVLRAVEDPVRRFSEDGLRIMRAARFVATLEFALDPATEKALAAAVHMLRKVSHERVRDELSKMLLARTPSRGLRVLQTSGALAILWPELESMVGCAQGSEHHAYDVWEHTLHTIDQISPELILRLAALFHDVAKPTTKAIADNHKITFHGHDIVGADMTRKLMHTFRFSKVECDAVSHLVRHHLVYYEHSWSDAAVRRFIKRVDPAHLDQLFALVRADNLGKGVPVDHALDQLSELTQRVQAQLNQKAAISLKSLVIGGEDVIQHLHIKPGRRVGALLERLLERVIEEPSLNSRETLLSLLDEMNHEKLD